MLLPSLTLASTRSTDAPFDPSSPSFSCKFPSPHFNSFIDLDGDCLADLFLMCDKGNDELEYQIWVNSKEKGFTFARKGDLPKGTKSVSFADMGALSLSPNPSLPCTSLSLDASRSRRHDRHGPNLLHLLNRLHPLHRLQRPNTPLRHDCARTGSAAGSVP